MNPLSPFIRSQADRGRGVMFAMVCVLTAWALALIYQCQQYVPDSLPQPYCGDLDAKKTRIVRSGHESLLLLFYRQLGLEVDHLDPTGRVPVPRDSVVVLLYPTVQIPPRMESRLVDFVRFGGRLIVFTDADLHLLDLFGLKTEAIDFQPAVGEPVAATIDVAGVHRLIAPAQRAVVSAGRPLIPLVKQGRYTLAGFTGLGSGSLVVVTPRLADYAWINEGDNGMFLTNLVLSSSARSHRFLQSPTYNSSERIGAPPVEVLDFDAEILTRLYAVERERGERQADARRRWSYDSLWSLIRANPCSAGLLQLLLAMVVFGGARAWRMGDPLPDHMGFSEIPGILQSHANLFEKAVSPRAMTARAIHYLHTTLIRRLGLDPDAGLDDISSALANVSPTAADGHSKLLSFCRPYLREQRESTESEMIHVWRLIDRVKKELDRQ